MSPIKATHISGDISVGRNIAGGGKLRIAGSATVGHNLRVEGWLEAPNIKGANKGVFPTAEKLREAYPSPHDGWIAGVGVSTPFAAYTGSGGEWTPTGGTIGITMDMTRYDEDVAQLQQDVSGIKASIGAADGIAPLNGSGVVSSQYLPGYVDDVLEFGGMAESVTVLSSRLEKTPADAGCRVVYDRSKATFVIESVTESADGQTAAYYSDWQGAELYGEPGDTGAVPCGGKIFVDTGTNKTYRWSGTTLTVVGSDLALGHTGGTAFPGDEGAALLERVEDTYSKEEVDAEIGGVAGYVNTTKALLNKDIETLAGRVNTLSGKVYTKEETYSKEEVDAEIGGVEGYVNTTKALLDKDIETLAGRVNTLSGKVDAIPGVGYTFVEDPDCNPLADAEAE